MKPIAVALALVASTTVVAADPPPKPKPGLTLPAASLNVAVNLELNASADRVGEPITIAPDLSYGVTPDLTVAVVHSLFAVTGFRARAGGGLCLNGEDGGCTNPHGFGHLYDNVGAEGWYSVARGPTAIALGGGVHATSLSAGFYSLKLGVKLRYTIGRVGLHALPSVLLAMTGGRKSAGDNGGVSFNKSSLWIPVQATYKAISELTVGLSTGVKFLETKYTGDTYEVPLGVMATYAIDPATTVGASWVFSKLLTGESQLPDPAPATEGVDFRGVQVWGSRTF